MDRTARALASFLDDGEEMRETWSVDTINRGFELSPPGMGGRETLGLTGRRLLWLDEELETVDLADVITVERESVRQSATPALLAVGGLALVLGVLATAALWLLMSLSTTVTVAPLAVGGAVFVLAMVVGYLREDGSDEGDVHHYLEVKTERTTVQIYAEEALVGEMADRIEAERS